MRHFFGVILGYYVIMACFQPCLFNRGSERDIDLEDINPKSYETPRLGAARCDAVENSHGGCQLFTLYSIKKNKFCPAAGAGDRTTDPQTRLSLPEEIISFLFVFYIIFLMCFFFSKFFWLLPTLTWTAKFTCTYWSIWRVKILMISLLLCKITMFKSKFLSLEMLADIQRQDRCQ